MRTRLFLITLIFLLPSVTLASSTVGSIQSSTQYAWGENTGWVNFAPDGGNIQITDTTLSGYAWDPIYGWLNLSPDGAGVKNDGQGNLSGSAWSAGAGWVNFNGVKITAAGEFTGTAQGATYGRLSFNCDTCKVATDWRPNSVRSIGINNSSGGSRGFLDRIYTWITSKQTKPATVKNVPAVTSPVILTRTLSYAHYDSQVKLLQQFLNQHGFTIAKKGAGSLGHENTFFGLATKAAVIKFQVAYGLKPANGAIGTSTRAKIIEILSGITPIIAPAATSTSTATSSIKITKTLSLGSRNQEVKLLQQFLNAHGFPIANAGVGSLGQETTYFGAATKQAVIEFQQTNGIKPANGTVGPGTRKAIESLSK